MLTYLYDLQTNKVIEFNIPLDEREVMINSGVYRLATPLERVHFIRNKPEADNSNFILPDNMLDVQFVSPRGTNDGYSSVGVFMEKFAKENGVFLNRHFTGQKIGLLYHHPRYVDLLETDYKILYTGFESSKMPEDWIPYLEKFNEIWTLSKFNQKALKELGFESKVMYHGINCDEFPLLERTGDRPLTFLHYDAFKWRKGWDLVLNAFEMAFGDSQEVKLILKTTQERTLPLDYPNVEIKKGRYSQERLLEVLKESDIFIFPSRGEGFGMTPLEAMSTGMPAIVTNEHGIADYFNDKFMWGVKGKEIPAKYDSSIFKDRDLGVMYEADIKELAELLQTVRQTVKKVKRPLNLEVSNYAKKWDAKPFIKNMTDRIKEVDKNFIVPKEKRKVQLSIIILTYNALDYTKKCLKSIAKNTEIDYEIIIIDNNSQDGTKTWLQNDARKLFKNIPMSITLNESNNGVAGGRNQGIKQASGNYCVFLDNDTEVSKGWENRMLNHFRMNPECWVVGNGGNYVDNYSPLRFRLTHSHLEVQSVDVVAGYCFMFPRKIIDLIGDQYMGLGKFWHEDLEFCGRVKKYGKQIILDSAIPIVHHAHKSAGEGKEDKIKQVHKGFELKAKKVGQHLIDENILTIFNDDDDFSAYSIIAKNITKHLRDLGLIVFRKPKIQNIHSLRSPSFDLCNGFDMSYNGKSLVYLHSENLTAPKAWADDLQNVDYALTCSDFARQALINANCQESKLVCHSLTGIQEQYFNWDAVPFTKEEWAQIVGDKNKDKFVFLNVGASQERKGQDILIKAFSELFGNNDDVILVIKNYNYGKHSWVVSLIGEYGASNNIIPIYEDWTPQKLASAYKYVSMNGAYIHPHRAEGVGMPILEALACGCRVGATDFGGISSLEGYNNLTKFGYKLAPSTFHNNPAEPFYESNENPQWAEPNINEVKEYMQKVFKTGYDINTARNDSKRIVREQSFETKAKEMLEWLRKV